MVRDGSNTSSGWRAFWYGVLATVVGGIVLALVLPKLLGPDLRLVNIQLYSNAPGLLTLDIMVHNDGSVSTGPCVASWEGGTPAGKRYFHRSAETSIFYVPAHSDAVYFCANSTNQIRFNIKWNDLPPNEDSLVYVSCSDGYRSSAWAIFRVNCDPSRSRIYSG